MELFFSQGVGRDHDITGLRDQVVKWWVY